MGRFPSEVVYSLPEYSNLDHDFWYNRRGVGATDYVPVGTAVQQEGGRSHGLHPCRYI
jgi:hypothetical protein